MIVDQPLSRPSSTTNRRWRLIAAVVFVILLGAGIALRVVISRAQPILRDRVIETLSTRFKSKVELANFNVSIAHGLEVSGTGLKIFAATDPNPYAPGVQPLISLREFHFQTAMQNLFRSAIHIDTVYVNGMELNLPPKEDRGELKNMNSPGRKLSIFVDKFVCQDTKLLINTSKPGKPPLEFDIHDLRMKDIGPGQPMHFDATLVNPKPVGDIQSTGLFGPWNEYGPRDTPVQGEYSFNHADLGTLKGIAGILSSTGNYAGTLGSIVVDGKTDTPDFRIARSGHAVPLHTDFHAVVDGTTGDTYLDPVKATLLSSSFTAKGSVVRIQNPHGHDIELDVHLDRAQIDDLLKLGVRTDPPIMTGPVEMTTKLSLPPGDREVVDRLQLAGTFHVLSAHFTNAKVQSRLDSLSLRTQGKPREARQQTQEENVPVDLRGVFTLKDGTLAFSLLHFQIPGTHVDMTGEYSLDGRTFDFRGTARLDAKLSQLTTGWKSILLRPVDRFFSKDGAGTEVPVKVTGTESEPHFGLDFGHKGDARNAGHN
jgi:hypothetical protein